MNFQLETKRLIIQPFHNTYLKAYFTEFTDEITKYQYPNSYVNIEEANKGLKKFCHKMEQGEMYECVIITKEKEFLGSVEVFGLKDKNPEIGLWLKESAQGNGYGFEVLKAVLIYLDETQHYESYLYEVDIRNTQSIHLINKFHYQKGECVNIMTESGKKLKLERYYIYSPVRIKE